MKQSSRTLSEVISMLDIFAPIKIIYNNEVLYNDYDGDDIATVLKDGTEIYGEVLPPNAVIPDRIKGRENNIINSINIKIVGYHHSIITLKGK